MSSLNPRRDRTALAILIVILVIIFVPLGYYLNMQINATVALNGCQCFPENTLLLNPRAMGTGVMNGTLANETAAHGPIPSYVQVIAQNNTIIFHSNNISLVVFAWPNFEAGYVLNTSIPSYDCFAPCPNPADPLQDTSSPSNSFTIYGLIQPTLVIERGSTINVTFVNMDPTDYHSFVMTSFAPPYAEYIMQNEISGGEMVQMTPLIPYVGYNTTANDVHMYEYTVHLNYDVTKLWYACMYPMHANQGMWGNITIV